MTQLAAGFSSWKLHPSVGQQPAALPSLAAASPSSRSRTRKLTLRLLAVSVLRADSQGPPGTDS